MEVRRRKTKEGEKKVDRKEPNNHQETEDDSNLIEEKNDKDFKNKDFHSKGDKNKKKLDEVYELDDTVTSTKIKINFELDIVALVLLFIALVTRFYKLDEPRNIVFDELHYGKYISLYLKRTFYFDNHPPLGKLIISGAAYLAGYDGTFKFDRIGSPYSDKIPLFAMRFVPAFCGSLIVPTTYHLALELGLKQWSAAIAGLLILFDNALLTQSRFVLLESILIEFCLLGILSVLKFRKISHDPTRFMWWVWLVFGIVSLTCAMCVKYIGFYSLLLGVYLIGQDYWQMLARKAISRATLLYQLVFRATSMIGAVLTIYLLVFYVHFSLLTKAGPHDSIMTSAFQASLQGGLASITKGQPVEVTHGSQITLRHTFGRACWLHSHTQMYPINYPDGRGSSHQQQVTCYSFKDVNNWWIVKRPEVNDLIATTPSEPIRHGEVIQLVHGITSRLLNSHDVAAPMTPQSQEVSCYVDYNISMPAQSLWKVHIVNREQTGDVWHAIQSQVRLVHTTTNYALKFSGRQLPDWGFNQHEIVADRHIEQSNTVWNVEEHRYTKSEDQKQRERDLINAEMIPLEGTKLTFWQKLVELQTKMLLYMSDPASSHMYSSGVLDWPFMTRGIAYWVDENSNAQIHLIGNIIIWYSGTFCIFVYLVFLFGYLMRRRRMFFDIHEQEWNRFLDVGRVLFGGYLLHYIPFLFVESTLFLHHYLPAFVFKVLLTAATVDHLYYFVKTRFKWKALTALCRIIVVIWMISVIYVFRRFCVLSYGNTALTPKEMLKLRWNDEWDFIIHKT